jgi:hypothetical protein
VQFGITLRGSSRRNPPASRSSGSSLHGAGCRPRAPSGHGVAPPPASDELAASQFIELHSIPSSQGTISNGQGSVSGYRSVSQTSPSSAGGIALEMKSTKSISQSDTRIEQQSTQGKKNDDAVKAQCSPATKFLITERLKTRLGRFVDANEFMDRACDGDCSFKFRDRDFVFAGSMLKPIYHFVVVSLRELLPHNAK